MKTTICFELQAYEIAQMINEGFLTELCERLDVKVTRVFSGRYADCVLLYVEGHNQDLRDFAMEMGYESHDEVDANFPILATT